MASLNLIKFTSESPTKVMCKLISFAIGGVYAVCIFGTNFVGCPLITTLLVGHLVGFLLTFGLESICPGESWKWGAIFTIPLMLLCIFIVPFLISEGQNVMSWIAVFISTALFSCFGGYAKKRFF